LIKLSYFVEHYGLVAAAIFVLFAILAAIILRRNFIKPTTHYLNLRLPLFSRLIKNMNLIIFSRTLSTLLKSGMNIDEALNLTGDTVSNYYYSRSLKSASENIMGGTKLSENLMRYGNLYPKIVTNMILVGEKAGTLEESLLYLEEYYQSEVDEAIKSLSSVIEPALLIFIGFAIGGLAISIITPIYMLTSNIR
jgi:type IV pilus assembly protein PilC